MLELYTFSISHFCEKARWALDRAQLPYVERILLPGPHLAVTRRLAAKTTVPILVHDGRSTQGSIAIHDYIDEKLAPGSLSRGTGDDDAARAWEARIDEALGVAARRIAYSGALSDAAGVVRLWCQGGPAWAKAFYWLAFPLVMSKVQGMYRSNDHDALAQARAGLDQAFDELDEVLARSPYLAGNAPGRVDFAVASLLAPLRFPAEHPAPWVHIPPPVQQLCQRYIARPAVRHVAKMYRLHRHVGAPYSLGRGGLRASAPETQSRTSTGSASAHVTDSGTPA